MKDFELLAKQWENAIMSEDDSLLILGGDTQPTIGNNCECFGNNCNCGGANNCNCSTSSIGNNCRCGKLQGGVDPIYP